MQELSLNVLDIAQNSVAANAGLVKIAMQFEKGGTYMTLSIEDNGKGMSEEMLKKVTDPFCTSRTTRKVGLGIPFLKQAAEMAGGTFKISSTEGVGTLVQAGFDLTNIDCMPIGDMASTITGLIQCSPHIDFVYSILGKGEAFELDTRQLRQILGDVSLDTPEVAVFIRSYIEENSPQ